MEAKNDEQKQNWQLIICLGFYLSGFELRRANEHKGFDYPANIR